MGISGTTYWAHTIEAERWLRQLHQRVTRARVMILGVLLAARRSLTHHEIAEHLQLQHERIDAVTVYRVLDWLVENAIAHRVAGADRAWRFAVIRPQGEIIDRLSGDTHPHFHCTVCDQMTCLPISKRQFDHVRLPVGFEPQSFNLMIEGCCADCRALRVGEGTQHAR